MFLKRISASPLTNAEEYCIRVINSDAYIEGADAAGVLYGCIDFYNKYLLQLEHPDDPDNFSKNPLESPLPDFELNLRPAVKNRGIWTWGHVIYDYRSFIDNMVMLKLSTANHAMNAVDEMRALNTDIKKIMDKNGAEYPVWREL